MAQPTVDIGTGAVLVFSASSWTAEIANFKRAGIKRAEIDTTHLGTTGGKTKMPGDLYDPGTLDVEFHYNPDSPPPYTATAETVQIQFPLAGTITTASHDKVSMFIVDLGYSVPLEEKMMGTIKLACSGSISHTNAA